MDLKEINVRSLHKHYGKYTVLENVNLHYHSGVINGIIGNNGAGKSTLLNCIAGFISYEGKIEKKYIEKIGILTANPYIFPRITGNEFIHFCLAAKNCKEDKKQIEKLNELFELPLRKFADEYSTGMLKKLHLLALILQQNDLLLLDEPFNGLDILSSAYLSELLVELKNKGTLLLVSSHDLEQLIKIAGTITIIENTKAYLRSDQIKDLQKEFEEIAFEKVKSINL